MSGPAISDEVYAAAGLALVPFGDDEDANLFEWHHCIDQPACRGATGPCPCSGMPWPSEAVRVAIAAALVASGYRREADVRAAIAYEIRAELVCCDIYERLTPKRAEISAGKPGWGEAYSELVDAIDDHDLCYWGDAAARIAESHELRTLGQATATALEQAQPLPVAGSFGTVVHEQTGLKGTSKAGQERSEEQRHG